MNVVFSGRELLVERVWYEAATGRLCIQAGDFVNGIPFGSIPDADFESQAPVISFEVGQGGSVVVCRHHDGVETWLPADLWLPEGFSAMA